MKSSNYIKRLANGDESALNDIYCSFRPGFIAYAGVVLHLHYDDAADLFQDSCMLLLSKVRKGELAELSDQKVGAYIKTTGKNLNSNRSRKRGIKTVHNENEISVEEPDSSEEEQIKQIVYDVVMAMPDPCSSILELQYYKNKKHAEIAKAMGYESAESVKTMACRCRGKVKALIRQRIKELGYE